MTRPRIVPVTVILAGLFASGCSAFPHEVHDGEGKTAITTAGAARVVEEYNAARADAFAAGDLEPLKQVDAAITLAIDSRQTVAAPFARPSEVEAGRFAEYPMWFVALCEIPQQDVQVAAVFERERSLTAWKLVSAPRLAADTAWPDVTTEGSAVEASDGSAAVRGDVTGEQLANRYADVLEDPASAYVDSVEVDSFITQMRQYAASQPAGVAFEQRWSVASPQRVLQLTDGGALVFANLVRREQYVVRGRNPLDFAGSAAERFLTEPIRRRATLTYLHQVLLLQPADDRALAIGQYGALVAARGR